MLYITKVSIIFLTVGKITRTNFISESGAVITKLKTHGIGVQSGLRRLTLRA
jgi:hypothetical protein